MGMVWVGNGFPWAGVDVTSLVLRPLLTLPPLSLAGVPRAAVTTPEQCSVRLHIAPSHPPCTGALGTDRCRRGSAPSRLPWGKSLLFFPNASQPLALFSLQFHTKLLRGLFWGQQCRLQTPRGNGSPHGARAGSDAAAAPPSRRLSRRD